MTVLMDIDSIATAKISHDAIKLKVSDSTKVPPTGMG
jgi:hypothetical protein